MCVILTVISFLTLFDLYCTIVSETCLSFLNPYFEPLTIKLKDPVTSVVFIHIRHYHVSLKVSKRLFYYLSDRVHVYVVFVFVQSV